MRLFKHHNGVSTCKATAKTGTTLDECIISRGQGPLITLIDTGRLYPPKPEFPPERPQKKREQH